MCVCLCVRVCVCVCVCLCWVKQAQELRGILNLCQFFCSWYFPLFLVKQKYDCIKSTKNNEESSCIFIPMFHSHITLNVKNICYRQFRCLSALFKALQERSRIWNLFYTRVRVYINPFVLLKTSNIAQWRLECLSIHSVFFIFAESKVWEKNGNENIVTAWL